MTPTLSVEAVQERVAALALTPLVARPFGADGGVESQAGGRGGGHGSLRGAVTGGVVGVDRHGVRSSAAEARGGGARAGRRADLGAVHVQRVAGDADVVGRRRPGDGDGGRRRAALGEIRGRRGRRRVARARARRHRRAHLPGVVACRVVGVNADRVRGAAAEAGDRPRSPGRGRARHAVDVDRVAGDTDVVGRRRPGDRKRGLGRVRLDEGGRSARRGHIARVRDIEAARLVAAVHGGHCPVRERGDARLPGAEPVVERDGRLGLAGRRHVEAIRVTRDVDGRPEVIGRAARVRNRVHRGVAAAVDRVDRPARGEAGDDSEVGEHGAGPAESPVRASTLFALGVASKETSKVPSGLSIAVFCQLAELVTHGEFETVTPAVALALLLLGSSALTRIVCGPLGLRRVPAVAVRRARIGRFLRPIDPELDARKPDVVARARRHGDVPDTVAPAAGAVTATVGGVVSEQTDVEALIDARVEWSRRNRRRRP